MIKSYFTLLLHAHLPFVRHPELDVSLEENWLFASITETYIPLLELLKEMEEAKSDVHITLSISPTLITMLDDKFIKKRYIKYLDRHLVLVQEERKRLANSPKYLAILKIYESLYQDSKELFKVAYSANLINKFKHFANIGMLELLTTCATHCLLPLYREYPEFIRAQIDIALNQHLQYFAKVPKGIWLPECGYYQGLEKILKEFGIEYFFVSAHALAYSTQIPERGLFAPVQCPNGVIAFPRDRVSADDILCNETGYPTDENYRDFYSDISFELSPEQLKEYLPFEQKTFTGLKYYSLLKNNKRELYNPQKALKKAEEHASDFFLKHRARLKKARELLGESALTLVPLDAEFLGHWWFEGIHFLKHLMKNIVSDDDIHFINPKKYLENNENELQSLQPLYSSWGRQGYAQAWVGSSNIWIYIEVHELIEQFLQLKETLTKNKNGVSIVQERLMKQAQREILLATSSDWPFIIKSAVMTDYARERVYGHINNTRLIFNYLQNYKVDTNWLIKLESTNNIFPFLEMDFT